LLALVLVHLVSAVRLWHENRAARPVAYAIDPATTTSSLASRTMLVSGVVLLAFIVFHLLHFTVRLESVNGTAIEFGALKEPGTGHQDVYAMMVAGFSVWYVAAFYIVAVGLLSLHLSHGVAASFQSLGLMNRAYRVGLSWLARLVAVVLFCGYVSIPVAVWLGHGQDYLHKVVEHSQTAALHPAKE
jgi:succinate dehydrogenase / fumarate reductase cytochrome b subunit